MPTSPAGHPGLSTLKNLVRIELPYISSSHLSEAIAAACGYGKYASHAADLHAPEALTLVSVANLDRDAFSKRLAELTPHTNEVAATAALVRLEERYETTFIPIGAGSKLLKTGVDLPVSLSRGTEADISSGLKALFLRDPAGLGGWGTRTLKMALAALPMIVSIRGPQQPLHGHYFTDCMSFNMFEGMLDRASEFAIPLRAQDALREHLNSLPSYVAGAKNEIAEQHHDHLVTHLQALLEMAKPPVFVD